MLLRCSNVEVTGRLLRLKLRRPPLKELRLNLRGLVVLEELLLVVLVVVALIRIGIFVNSFCLNSCFE